MAEDKQYRTIVEDTPMGILLHAKGTVLFVNNAAVEILATSKAKMIGSQVVDWIHPSDRADALRRVKKTFETKKLHRAVELRALREDGAPVLLEVMGSLNTWDGESAIQLVFADITNRKKAELNASRRRDQELRAQKLESIGRLAGGVAHDFNNILTGILGYTELIELSHSDDIGLLDDLREIRNAAVRGASLTRQLLAYSRRQPILPKVISPIDALENLKSLLVRVVEKNVKLSLELAPDTMSVFLDQGQFDQVIMNLVVNGGEAMDSGGTVTVRAQNVDLVSGSFVRIDVLDEGPGFSEEAQDRAFEPFFSTKSDGTGLGLSTLYGIVQQNSGYVQIHSMPKGSMVSVFLPVDARAPLPLKMPPTRGKNGAESVLVVEDDPVLRRMVKRTLERAGYTVSTAGTVNECWELLQNGASPDLILTDVVLPDDSGAALHQRVRAAYPSISLGLMTGYMDSSLNSHPMPEDLPFLLKPFTTEQLILYIQECLARPELPARK